MIVHNSWSCCLTPSSRCQRWSLAKLGQADYSWRKTAGCIVCWSLSTAPQHTTSGIHHEIETMLCITFILLYHLVFTVAFAWKLSKAAIWVTGHQTEQTRTNLSAMQWSATIYSYFNTLKLSAVVLTVWNCLNIFIPTGSQEGRLSIPAHGHTPCKSESRPWGQLCQSY